MDYKDIIKRVPVLGFVVGWLASNNADYGGLLAITGVSMLVFVGVSGDVTWTQMVAFTIAFSPVWITYFVFKLFYWKWMDQVGKNFSIQNGRTTLRIKLPEEVSKSPEAMEFVISQIHNTANPDNLMQTYLQGKRPLNFSLELVSIGGEVRFYVNLPTLKSKPAFEANMYAQYPGVEIIEESVDYTNEIPLNSNEWSWMSFHMGKKKDQEFPIKSFREFELDRMPKEEEKVDPITPMLEVMSSIAPDERIYVQFIINSFRKDSFKNGQLVTKEGPDWSEKVHELINEMMNRDPDTKAAKEGGGAEEIARLTSGERDAIHAMERNAEKYAYRTGIRWMYFHKKDKFNSDRINPMIRVFSQWDIIGRNMIGVKWRTDLHYKDLIPGSYRKIEAFKAQEFKEYKLRLYFPKEQGDYPKIFTAEELASIYHLPGKVALTPSLSRVGSTRGEAPSNLPISDLPTP
ncbi:hypothetical protein CL653_01515 [bacterium]|nr:hypothetical protein [bacterium]